MVNSHASGSGLFAGSLSVPDFCYEHTHTHPAVEAFTVMATNSNLMQAETTCPMKIFIFTLLSCIFGNAYLVSYPTQYCSTLVHPYIGRNVQSQQKTEMFLELPQGFPTHVGALSAFPHHGGNMKIFGNMKTSPSFCGWGCWGSHSPCLWELLLSWASAVWPWPETQLPPCLASAGLTPGLGLPQCPRDALAARSYHHPLGDLSALLKQESVVPWQISIGLFVCIVQEMVVGILFLSFTNYFRMLSDAYMDDIKVLNFYCNIFFLLKCYHTVQNYYVFLLEFLS